MAPTEKLMSSSSLNPDVEELRPPSPSKELLLPLLTFTVLLLSTAALASFAAEFAFVSFVSPSLRRWPRFVEEFVRVPLDLPGEWASVPAHMVDTSCLDFVARAVVFGFAVFGSGLIVRSLGLWDGESED